jgi:hypothetical protein
MKPKSMAKIHVKMFVKSLSMMTKSMANLRRNVGEGGVNYAEVDGKASH